MVAVVQRGLQCMLWFQFPWKKSIIYKQILQFLTNFAMACEFTNLKSCSWCLDVYWQLVSGFVEPLLCAPHPLWTDSQPGTDVYLHFPLELVHLQSSNHRFLRRNERTKGAQRWRSSHDAPMDPVFSLFSPRATKISSRQRRRTHDICLRLIETEGCLGDWDVPSVLRAGWLQWGKNWETNDDESERKKNKTWVLDACQRLVTE